MGKVIGKRVENGENLVDLELATQNEKGEKKILGEATVRVA